MRSIGSAVSGGLESTGAVLDDEQTRKQRGARALTFARRFP
jgi:hypothetical protein